VISVVGGRSVIKLVVDVIVESSDGVKVRVSGRVRVVVGIIWVLSGWMRGGW